MTLPADQQAAVDDFCIARATEYDRPFGPIAEKRLRATAEKLFIAGYDLVLVVNASLAAHWLNIYPNEQYRRTKRGTRETGATLAVVPIDREKAAEALKTAKTAIYGSK